MLMKNQHNCPALTANDGCRLHELLHPKNDDIALTCSLALAEVEPHESSYQHRMVQSEVYYVLSGRGLMHIDAQTQEVTAGDAVYIPGGAVQWIDNPGDELLRFIAIVSPPWDAADDSRL